MATSSAADRYATSLFELAVERGELETVQGDVASFVHTLQASPELRAVLVSPVITSAKKLAILNKLYADRFTPLLLGFFENISIRNREALLAAVMESFLGLYLSRKGIEKALVTSAKPLSEAATSKLQTLAEGISQKKVLLTTKTDPTLLGGFVLRIGDYELDQSVAARLERVRRKLKASA